MQTVDLLLTHAAQLVTCASPDAPGQPKRGEQMREAGIITDGALAVSEGVIVAVGHTHDVLRTYEAAHTLDLSGKSVIPGLVDCHTHVPFAGDRFDEFEMRVMGRSYMQIMQAGGGILSTVRATRAAPLEKIVALGRARLRDMLRLGTTTVEMKTGYGLSPEAELKLLNVILALAAEGPQTVIPTFLGAHTIPPEHDGAASYIDELLTETLPRALAAYQASELPGAGLALAVDIFVEDGVFSVNDMRRYFTGARALPGGESLALTAHLDQFTPLGAVPLAVEWGARSVDHLETTPPADLDALAASQTVGVMLPTVNFNLGVPQFGDARHLIDAGGALALATDYNPGSSPTLSLPLVMAIACRYQKLLPAEALNAITLNAAAALGLADRLGSLDVGKRADLVVLGTPDYRALIVEFGRNPIERVLIDGQSVWAAP